MASSDEKTYSYQRWNGNGWGDAEPTTFRYTCDGAGLTPCPHGSPLAKYTVTRYYLCEQCARVDYLMTGAFKPTEEQVRAQLAKVSKAPHNLDNPNAMKIYALEQLHLSALLVGKAFGRD